MLTICFCSPALGVPQFRKVMGGERFREIRSVLRFVSSDRAFVPRVPKTDVRYDRMWKVRMLLDHLNRVSKTLMVPGEFISLDEMMVKATCKYIVCRLCRLVVGLICACLRVCAQRQSASRFASTTSRRVMVSRCMPCATRRLGAYCVLLHVHLYIF